MKISKLYILPGHQRRGYGREILAHICAEARILGAVAVWLPVKKRNERAIGAYQKAGFQIIGEAAFEIGGGFVIDDYLKAKAV